MKLIKIFFLLIISLGCLFCQDMQTPFTINEKQFRIPALKLKDINPIVQIEINVIDTLKEFVIQEMVFDTKGTTNIKDIESASVYYYDSSQSISKPIIPANAKAFGKKEKPQLKIIFKDIIRLKKGFQFFCLSYKLSKNANVMNYVSATCSKIVTNRGIADLNANKETPHRIGIALRQHNDDNVHTYRIPCLVSTGNKSLIAVYDVRHKNWNDLQGDIDIGMSRSLDGGNNWDKMKIVMDMGEYNGLPQKYNGIGDPCVICDKNNNNIFVAGLWMHGVLDDNGKFVEGLTENSSITNNPFRKRGSQPGFDIKETAQFMISKSINNGLTWSKPVSITKKCKRKEWWLYFQAPGNGITMRDGTIVFPAQGRDSSGKTFSNIVYSKDDGETWSASSIAFVNTTECSIVEIDSGIIMLNARDESKNKDMTNNGRAIAITSDMGITWTEHITSRKELIEPVCMASLIKHEYIDGGKKKAVLLFSNPDSKTERKNLTIKVSFDNGNSWPERYKLVLDERIGRGYSSLTSIDENTIGILYESSQSDLVFEKIKLKEILDLKNKK